MRLGYPIFIIKDNKSKRIPSLGKPILRLCCLILRLGNMDDSKFGLPDLKIGTQTWNSKFGLPNLKIGQIPSLGTTYSLSCYLSGINSNYLFLVRNLASNNLPWLPWLCHVTSSTLVMTSIWNIMMSP